MAAKGGVEARARAKDERQSEKDRLETGSFHDVLDAAPRMIDR
jgi:hypothetical protein